jgi:hypothetical protein
MAPILSAVCQYGRRPGEATNQRFDLQIGVIEAHECRLWFGRLVWPVAAFYVARDLQITKGESFQWSVYTDCDRVAGRKRFSKRIVEQRIEMGSFGFTQAAPL